MQLYPVLPWFSQPSGGRWGWRRTTWRREFSRPGQSSWSRGGGPRAWGSSASPSRPGGWWRHWQTHRPWWPRRKSPPSVQLREPHRHCGKCSSCRAWAPGAYWVLEGLHPGRQYWSILQFAGEQTRFRSQQQRRESPSYEGHGAENDV